MPDSETRHGDADITKVRLRDLTGTPLVQLVGVTATLFIAGVTAGSWFMTAAKNAAEDEARRKVLELETYKASVTNLNETQLRATRDDLRQCMSQLSQALGCDKPNVGAVTTARPIGDLTQIQLRKVEATTACDLLTLGNKSFGASDARSALAIYRNVEKMPDVGADPCTGSIFATIATIFTDQAARATQSNERIAITYYKEASKYNRWFAYAALCRLGECRPYNEVFKR